jgi:hypothetical protein
VSDTRSHLSSAPGRADLFVALAFGLLLAVFIAISWQKWPLLTADSARELYVPFQIRHGAVIYRDFAYLYGPVAPYFQAGLLGVFGDRLEVLYIASLLSLAGTMTLLYTLARQVLSSVEAAVVLWIFFTHFALGQDIWGYVWPYAFAATDGVFLGLVVLVALARHARTGTRAWLGLAGLALGLSVMTKLEYGLAAGAIGVVYGFLRAFARPGLKIWAFDALALVLPALLVALAIATWVLQRVPPALVLDSVWPVKLMRMWDSQGTWHGSWVSWGANLRWGLLVLWVMTVALTLCRMLESMRRFEPWGRAWVFATLAGGVVLLGKGGFYLANAGHYWMGPGFLLLFGVLLGVAGHLRSAWQARTPPDPRLVVWALIGAYGCLVATRTLMLGYNDYMRYQAPVALIAWVALASRWLPAWLGACGWLLKGQRPGQALLCVLVGVLGLQQAQSELTGYLAPHVAVTGSVGTVLATPEFALPFLGALAYVKSHTRPGDRIVAAPMEASFYLFSGLDNVLHEDQLYWGYLTTHAEQQAAIARMEDRHVCYVLVSNYGDRLHGFGTTYMQDLGQWLKTECHPVARFGTAGYRVQVFATHFASGYSLARVMRR